MKTIYGISAKTFSEENSERDAMGGLHDLGRNDILTGLFTKIFSSTPRYQELYITQGETHFKTRV